MMMEPTTLLSCAFVCCVVAIVAPLACNSIGPMEPYCDKVSSIGTPLAVVSCCFAVVLAFMSGGFGGGMSQRYY